MKLDLPPTFSVVGRKMGVRLRNANAHLTHINFFCLYAMTTDHFSPEALTYEVRKLTLQKKESGGHHRKAGGTGSEALHSFRPKPESDPLDPRQGLFGSLLNSLRGQHANR